MQKEVKKMDKRFFQTKGASESTLFRKRNFLATDDDEVSIANKHYCIDFCLEAQDFERICVSLFV